jgi:hypothetical protein
LVGAALTTSLLLYTFCLKKWYRGEPIPLDDYKRAFSQGIILSATAWLVNTLTWRLTSNVVESLLIKSSGLRSEQDLAKSKEIFLSKAAPYYFTMIKTAVMAAGGTNPKDNLYRTLTAIFTFPKVAADYCITHDLVKRSLSIAFSNAFYALIDAR